MKKNTIKDIIFEIPVITKSLLDRETPAGAKIIAAVVLIYLINPFDFIPDFAFFPGIIDDGVLVTAGIWLIYKIIPPEITDKHRDEKLE